MTKNLHRLVPKLSPCSVDTLNFVFNLHKSFKIKILKFYIKALFQNQEENGDESDEGSGDDDSGTDHVNCTITRTQLGRCEHKGGVDSALPDIFQTNNLLFYERFKAFQDYMLGMIA